MASFPHQVPRGWGSTRASRTRSSAPGTRPAAPELDPKRLAAFAGRGAGWQEVVADADASGPHGFLLSWRSGMNQLPFLQVATWNDYNEGTPIEMGIDNCYTVSASISGSTLSWQAVPNSPNASPSTIARWLVFDSTDGGSTYQQIAALPVGTTSYDLSGLPTGSHTLFVEMAGKPDIVNRSSSQLSFTH